MKFILSGIQFNTLLLPDWPKVRQDFDELAKVDVVVLLRVEEGVDDAIAEGVDCQFRDAQKIFSAEMQMEEERRE